eukprot:Lankesteria_metandrocarpae@DN4598_c0_g1_i1.p1
MITSSTILHIVQLHISHTPKFILHNHVIMTMSSDETQYDCDEQHYTATHALQHHTATHALQHPCTTALYCYLCSTAPPALGAICTTTSSSAVFLRVLQLFGKIE